MSICRVSRIVGFLVVRTVDGRLENGKCEFDGQLSKHLGSHEVSRGVHCVRAG